MRGGWNRSFWYVDGRMMLVRWTCGYLICRLENARPADEVESVSAGMILRSVSTAVGTDDKVTVDNFAGWLVNERPMCWAGWFDTSSDRELTTPILRGWMFFERQIINAAYFARD